MADLISVIVPVYQSETHLKRCVDSVLSQTYENLEVILVDDGSRDRSLEICQEYADLDSRVKVIHKEHGGVSGARNEGLRQMSGDYLMFIDSDDYIQSSMAAELLAAIHRHRADMVICGFKMVYEDGRPEVRHSIDTPFIGTLEEFLNQQFLSLYDKLLINTQSNKMYSAKLQQMHQIFYDEHMAINEDTCISLRMLQKCKRIACINGDFLNYWQYSRPQSLVTRFHENGVDTCFTLLDEVRACMKAGKASQEVTNQINNRMLFHICGFAGLPYYRSSWSFRRCYEEIRRLAGHQDFRRLLKETTPVGIKNRVATFVLGQKWCLLYHGMCLLVYRKQRRLWKGYNHEQ